MSTIINENKGFESINRDLIFDNSLSDRARFVYVYMSAKPEGWNFYISHMCKELGYSENTLRKYIDELIAGGWLIRLDQKKLEGGKFGSSDYIIKAMKSVDTPQFDRVPKITVRQNLVHKEIKNNIRDLDIIYNDIDTAKTEGGSEIKSQTPNDKVLNDFLNSQILIEGLCKNEHITPEQCKRLAVEVFNEWSFTAPKHYDDNDKKKHLLSCIRAKAKALREQGGNLGEREQRLSLFKNQCRQLVEGGEERNLVGRFAAYYTQPTQDGTGRMLFETYKAWDTNTRFKIFKQGHNG